MLIGFDQLPLFIGWLPKHLPGNYLYIRPAVVGLGDKLGYQIPDQAMLFVVATPYRDLSRSPEGKPLSLKLQCSSPDSVRAWPGGFGYAKLGANYGPSLQAHRAALGNGFDQILWLFGEEKLVTEAGANNLFLVWKNKDTARNELVTPCLQNKMILSGITRRSVIELAKSKFTQSVGNLDPVDVIERDISIKDIDNVAREGRLVDAFVAGTAVSNPEHFIWTSRATNAKCSTSLCPYLISEADSMISLFLHKSLIMAT